MSWFRTRSRQSSSEVVLLLSVLGCPALLHAQVVCAAAVRVVKDTFPDKAFSCTTSAHECVLHGLCLLQCPVERLVVLNSGPLPVMALKEMSLNNLMTNQVWLTSTLLLGKLLPVSGEGGGEGHSNFSTGLVHGKRCREIETFVAGM